MLIDRLSSNGLGFALHLPLAIKHSFDASEKTDECLSEKTLCGG